MKKLSIILALILITISISFAQEQLTHLDEAGKIDVIDSKLNSKIKIFTEYEGFEEAKLYQKQDETYVLEVFYKPNGKSSKTRKDMTKEEVTEMRSNVTAQVKLSSPSSELNQEGREYMLYGNGIASIYYGLTVPVLLNIDINSNAKTFLGIGMITASAGFAIPYFASRNSQVSKADGYMAIYGQSRGAIHGFALSIALEVRDPRLALGTAFGMSILEGVGGYYLSRENNFSTGTASTMRAMGDFGLVLAPLIAGAAGGLDNNQYAPQILGGSVLLGGGLGLFAGKYMNKNEDFSEGDAYQMVGSGLLGYYVPLSILSVVNVSVSGQALFGILAAGNLIGIETGVLMAKKSNLTGSQGRYVLLGELAGGVFGAGIGYLAFKNNISNSGGYVFAASGVGATAAFIYLTNYYAKKMKKEENNSRASIDFNINPIGFMGVTNQASAKDLGPAPMFNLGITF